MKLITFQTKEALSVLQKTGILTTDASYIDMKKASVPYNWLVPEMKKRNIVPHNGEKYPIWAWAKCGSSIAPKKKKNYFGTQQKKLVRITFEKQDSEVLLSDYMAYSFILSGRIIPRTKIEYQNFLQKVEKSGISLDDLKGFVRNEKSDKKVIELFSKIKKTWNRIFVLKSTVHQACVWNIKLSEVVKIEVLEDTSYMYGTMNAKRKDGSRPNWKKVYLKFLK